jgi:hypothetical protein
VKSSAILRGLASSTLVIFAGCGGNSAPGATAQSDPCAGAAVQLFADANYADRQISINYPGDQASLRSAGINTGAGDLNDRVSSARWTIPVGCRFVLFDDENFRGTSFPLIGSGRMEQNPNLGSFGDKASSARWERS